MTDTGNINRYDTVSRRIETVSPTGENIVPVHDITDEEFAEYSSYYPEVNVEQTQEINSVLGHIANAVEKINLIKSSGLYDRESLEGISILTQQALMSYRTLQYTDLNLSNSILDMVCKESDILVAAYSTLNEKFILVRDHSMKLEGRVDALERGL